MAKTAETFALELTGQFFGRWTVERKSEKRGLSGEIYWCCRCSCGACRDITAGSLRNGSSKSCGCLSKEMSTKHGMEGTRTYDCWAHMLDRCRNPKNRWYHRYGGRGIKVCQRWHDFRNFLADMGEKPDGLSIERIENDLDYQPGNCKWATRTEQIRNREISPRYIWAGKEQSLAALAEEYGIPRRRLYQRMLDGWSLSDALSVKRATRWTRRETAQQT